METEPQGDRDQGGGRQVAAGIEEPPPREHHIIPVWFFIGVQLLIYGVLIFASGLAEYSNPPDTVLANLHAPVWWGALLVAIGGVYVYLFRPGRK
jgi:FtsH-binding integral membrane protein